MVELLVKIALALQIPFTDFGKVSREKPYKELLKKVRTTMKKYHPDNGGDADKFRQIQPLYEQLLRMEKHDDNAKAMLAALNSITVNASRLEASHGDISAITDQAKNIDLSRILDEVMADVSIVIPRSKQFQVDIAELALHFNTLKYCKIRVLERPGEGKVCVRLKLHAINQLGEQSEAAAELWMDYTQTGKYTCCMPLNCERGETVTIHTLGFDEPHAIKVTDAGVYTVVFDENDIMFTLKIRVYIP